MALPRPRTNAFTKKRAVFTPVSSSCEVCTTRLNTSSAFRDTSGNYWCQDHEKRGKLLNWAVKQNYPFIQFLGSVKQQSPVPGLPDYIGPTKYAIGGGGETDNKMCWQVSILHGCDDLIEAAIAYVKGR